MTKLSKNENDFGKSLTYAARAPFTWSIAENIVPDILEAENEHCLRTILSLSEHHSFDGAEEIAALERKVDITLEMVAMLLRAAIDMPSVKGFQLGAHEITWQQVPPLPEVGVSLNIIIYLHELYPKPLTLPGYVKSVSHQECTVELTPQSTDVQQLLEKFIFLHHRRAIAQAKQS